MKSRLVNALVDLLLDIVCWFTREQDDDSRAPADVPLKQSQPGGRHGRA
jgi:hypothetical protein